MFGTSRSYLNCKILSVGTVSTLGFKSDEILENLGFLVKSLYLLEIFSLDEFIG